MKTVVSRAPLMIAFPDGLPMPLCGCRWCGSVIGGLSGNTGLVVKVYETGFPMFTYVCLACHQGLFPECRHGTITISG
jgi:hypothetical protein